MGKEIIKNKPIFFDKKEDLPKDAEFIDTYEGSLKELFFVRNPKLKLGKEDSTKELQGFLEEHKNKEIYVYFPWSNKAVAILPENLFLELRTARNKNFINAEEQKSYYNFKVGILGMSIGSSVLWPLTMSGGGKDLRIADFDEIDLKNLNRLLFNVTDIGKNKALAASEKVYEMNPYAKMDVWLDGVKEDKIVDFLEKDQKLDVVIDEIDNLEMKINLRLEARKLKIPVLMATNVGEKVMLDVERFDLEPEREIFHGLLGDVDPKNLKGLVPHSPQWVEVAGKIVDKNNFSEKFMESIREVGVTIAGVPQLGINAVLSGAMTTFAIQQIAKGGLTESGRYLLNLDKLDKIK